MSKQKSASLESGIIRSDIQITSHLYNNMADALYNTEQKNDEIDKQLIESSGILRERMNMVKGIYDY